MMIGTHPPGVPAGVQMWRDTPLVNGARDNFVSLRSTSRTVSRQISARSVTCHVRSGPGRNVPSPVVPTLIVPR